MPSWKDPRDFLDGLITEADGLVVRDAREHSRDKLGILAMYLPAFALACKRAGQFYFVDGLSGPGMYYFKDSDSFLLGSTPIALNVSDPPFTKCLAVDIDPKNIAALQTRGARHGGRLVAREGNVNRDLIRLMTDELPRGAPILAFLDPAGLELEWQTVQKVARFRSGKRKVELLILVPTSSIPRVGPVTRPQEEHGASKIHFMFPGRTFEEVRERRERGEITPEQAREALAESYCEELRKMGYAWVEKRPITTGTRTSASVYHLVFATDAPAGKRIMEHVFKTMYSNVPKPPTKAPPSSETGRLPGF